MTIDECRNVAITNELKSFELGRFAGNVSREIPEMRRVNNVHYLTVDECEKAMKDATGCHY
jgi:hypothetical protein